MESMGKKSRQRRSFTPEFKAEIVELCQRGDRSVGSVPGRQCTHRQNDHHLFGSSTTQFSADQPQALLRRLTGGPLPPQQPDAHVLAEPATCVKLLNESPQ